MLRACCCDVRNTAVLSCAASILPVRRCIMAEDEPPMSVVTTHEHTHATRHISMARPCSACQRQQHVWRFEQRGAYPRIHVKYPSCGCTRIHHATCVVCCMRLVLCLHAVVCVCCVTTYSTPMRVRSSTASVMRGCCCVMVGAKDDHAEGGEREREEEDGSGEKAADEGDRRAAREDIRQRMRDRCN